MTTPTYPYAVAGPAEPVSDANGVGLAVTTTVYTAPPPPPPHRVRLGASDLSAFAGVNVGVHRTYYGMTTDTDPARMASVCAADKAMGATSLVSINPGIVAGKSAPYDKQRMEQFRQALHVNPDTLLICWHEPEDPKWKATPADFVSFYNATAAQFPGLDYLGPVLMGWTFAQGRHTPWLTGLARQDFSGWDTYFHGDADTCQSKLDPLRLYAENLGVPFVLAETGQVSSADQAGWVGELAAWAGAHQSVAALSYWNHKGPNGDYTLTPAGMAAFARALGAPPFAAP